MINHVDPTKQQKSDTARAEFFLLLIVMIWGVNFVVVKAALSEFLPHAFNGVRFALASLVLLAVAHVRNVAIPRSWKEVAVMLGLGVLYTTFYQIFFIEGIARTTAANSGLILGATPVFVALASHILGNERLHLPAWLGIVLAFTGLFLLIQGGRGAPSWSEVTFRGDMLVLVAMLLWSAYTVIARPFVQRYSTTRLTFMSTLMGSILLLLWGIPSLLRQHWRAVSVAGWAGALFSGLFSIAIAYLVWNNSVSKAGPTRTALFSNLVPIIAVISGVVFLNEPMSRAQVAGAVLVIAGVLLARLSR